MKTTMLKIVIISLLVTSCEMYDTFAQYSYQYPDSIGDGFDVGSLKSTRSLFSPVAIT